MPIIAHCVKCTELKELIHSEGNRAQDIIYDLMTAHNAEVDRLKAEIAYLTNPPDCHEIADCNCTEEGCKTCRAGGGAEDV